MNLILKIQDEKNVILQLNKAERVIDELHLTISQDFDTLLIRTIDNLLAKNRIDRLSLKRLIIPHKMRQEAVSTMIIKAVKSALEV